MRSRVLEVLIQESLQYPPELYCRGGTDRSRDRQRLVRELGKEDGELERKRLESIRHPRSAYLGDINPITFGVFDGGDLVGGLQLWGIRRLPRSKPRQELVSARPFPAFPGMEAGQLVSFVIGVMVQVLGRPLELSDGSTIEVRQWETLHFRKVGGRGDGSLDLFERGYNALIEQGLTVVVSDDTHDRKVWRIGPGGG